MELASQESPAATVTATGLSAWPTGSRIGQQRPPETPGAGSSYRKTIAYQGYGSTEWVRVLGRVVLTSKPTPGSRAEHAARTATRTSAAGARSPAFRSSAPRWRSRSAESPRGSGRPGRTDGHCCPGFALARLAHGRAARRRHRACRRQDLCHCPRHQVRHRLRHRRHRHGHRAPPAVPCPVEHVCAQRAGPDGHPGHGCADGPADGGTPRRPGDLPVHRPLERGPHAGPVPHAATCTPPVPCC